MVEIVVVFKDGEKLILEKVTNYIFDGEVYEVHKFGHRMFLNAKEVKYIGRTFDINNEKVRI